MKLEVKYIKTKVGSDIKYCKECKCKTKNTELKKTVKNIEDNILKLLEKDISKLKEDK